MSDSTKTAALANISRAEELLAKAETLDEVKKIQGMAAAFRALAKAAHLGREQEYRAAEISLLAARKAGKILEKLPRARPKAKGGRARDSAYYVALSDAGIPYRTAQRWQAVAEKPESVLRGYFSAMRKDGKAISTVGFLSLIKSKSKPHKGKSPYTRHISIPLKEAEYWCIMNWARQSFPTEGFLHAEQKFIREILSDYFRETGMANIHPELGMEAKAAIQERLLKWLAQKPISASPLFKEVMKERGDAA